METLFPHVVVGKDGLLGNKMAAGYLPLRCHTSHKLAEKVNSPAGMRAVIKPADLSRCPRPNIQMWKRHRMLQDVAGDDRVGLGELW